jgi:hypothetical protein
MLTSYLPGATLFVRAEITAGVPTGESYRNSRCPPANNCFSAELTYAAIWVVGQPIPTVAPVCRHCPKPPDICGGTTDMPQLNKPTFSSALGLDPPSWLQRIQQALGLLQIKRVKTFGEPAVDRGEKIVSLMLLALIAPQPSHAYCRAQFP